MPNRAEVGPDLVAIEAARAEFHVGRATIFRYLESGDLTRYGRQMDRKTYVSRSEIRRLLTLRKKEKRA